MPATTSRSTCSNYISPLKRSSRLRKYVEDPQAHADGRSLGLLHRPWPYQPRGRQSHRGGTTTRCRASFAATPASNGVSLRLHAERLSADCYSRRSSQHASADVALRRGRAVGRREADPAEPEDRRDRGRRRAVPGGRPRPAADPHLAHADLGRHRAHAGRVRQGRLDRQGAPAARQGAAWCSTRSSTDGLAADARGGAQQARPAAAAGLLQRRPVVEVGAGVSRLRGRRPGGLERQARRDRRACRSTCARKVPDAVGDDDAAFTVLGAIALQGIRLAQPTLGEASWSPASA